MAAQSNRRHHLPPDSFDDSSSSLSSDPSGHTTMTTSSSSTMSSSCETDLMSHRSLPPTSHHHHQSLGYNAKKRHDPSCHTMNDLNSGMSQIRCSPRKATHGFRKNESSCGSQDCVTTRAQSVGFTDWEKVREMGGLNQEEHSGERLKPSGSNASPKLSNGKAVAVIKGTASNSSSSTKFSSTLGSSSHNEWKKHLHSHEVRKLKRDLEQSNEKVATLTSQLTTHGHMVTAFEQSLASMSVRLQQLTVISSQKDAELMKMKNKMEEMKSRGISQDSNPLVNLKKTKDSKKEKESHRQEKEKRNLLIRRHTFVSPACDSDSGIMSSSSRENPGHKEGRWFRAFRRSGKDTSQVSSSTKRTDYSSDHEVEVQSSPRISSLTRKERKNSPASSDTDSSSIVPEIRRQLKEKDKTITDLKLELLTCAHQIQSLEEQVSHLKKRKLGSKTRK